MGFYHRRISSGSKQIGRGIKINWIKNSITITANFEVSGAKATQEMAFQMAGNIMKYWNASLADDYQVLCNATAVLRSEKSSADPSHSQIFVSKESSASFTETLPSHFFATMHFHFNGKSTLDFTPAHEFGHMMGLVDHYDEGFVSRVKDLVGKERKTAIQPGFENNIMAVVYGVVEKINLQELFELHAMELVWLGKDDLRDRDRGTRRLYAHPDEQFH